MLLGAAVPAGAGEQVMDGGYEGRGSQCFKPLLGAVSIVNIIKINAFIGTCLSVTPWLAEFQKW